MGYEMGFAKRSSDEGAELDDVMWFSCGWALTDLHHWLCESCHVDSDGFGECKVSLDDLAFIEALGARLRSQHLNDLLGTLAELDPEYVDELVVSFPEPVLAAMRLAYAAPDEATSAQREVCAILCKLEEGDYRGITLRMVDSIERMRGEGMNECILFAG